VAFIEGRGLLLWMSLFCVFQETGGADRNESTDLAREVEYLLLKGASEAVEVLLKCGDLYGECEDGIGISLMKRALCRRGARGKVGSGASYARRTLG